MADLISMLAAASGIGAEEADPNFNQTVLLLHGDGTNGAQNNTFLDSSTNNFTITRNGNTTQGTFSPFSLAAGEWSNYFDGTGDKLTVAANSAFQFGTGDFAIEFWFYPTSLSSFQTAIDMGYTASGSYVIQTGNGNGIPVFYSAGSALLTSSSAWTANAFNHVAVCRSGTTLSMFINGSRTATATNSTNLNSNSTLGIGAAATQSPDYPVVGYMSNVRLVKGSAVYDPTSTTLTVPTTPLTAITNTSLLTCQSNRFVDNSTNAFAITRNGDVRVTPFSPFAPTAAYSAGTNGGSGYFDGTGDYLTVPNNAALQLGGGDFTIECWVNGASQNAKIILSKRNSAISHEWLLYTNANGFIDFSYNTGQAGFASTILLNNSWQHIAVVRASGTITMYINGVSAGSSGTALNNSTNNIGIGAGAGGDSPFLGYIAGVRLVKGTAVYTSAFTPPTSPPTAITNTSLLCNFTNAGIFDNTGKNNLETVGNAQIDTTTKKYGTGSLEFDGTEDYLVIPSSPDTTLGSGDFTIEMWINTNSTAVGSRNIYDQRTTATQVVPVISNVDNTIVYFVNGATRITSSTISSGVWYHLAICRSGTSTKMFLDGSQVGSTYTDSNNYLQNPINIGRYPVISGAFFAGYIDDLRITKGVARYTANFNPPTAAFPNE